MLQRKNGVTIAEAVKRLDTTENSLRVTLSKMLNEDGLKIRRIKAKTYKL